MSVYDPTAELNEICNRARAGRLPAEALDWGKSTLETAESILDTIDSMEEAGVDAPTDAQAIALKNIYKGACRWLHITPVLA